MERTTTTPFHVVMHSDSPWRPPAPTAATTLATGNLCQWHASPARDLNMKITRKITTLS